jgi:hypothetical protein
MNKDTKLLAEAYENIMQSQHNQAKELFYKNVMNKFMQESPNKNMQGFESWLDNQMEDGKFWNNDQEYQKMHQDLQKKKLVPSDMTEFHKEITDFVSKNIGSDERAWAAEAV